MLERPVLGLGKTTSSSSACIVTSLGPNPDFEIALTERLNRKKASGLWPELAIRQLASRHDLSSAAIAENRDFSTPHQLESHLHQMMPFFDHLKDKGLARYSSALNKEISFYPHHQCHASAAALMSPFEKCLILVIDGAGTKTIDFPDGHFEVKNFDLPNEIPVKVGHEEHSIYLLDLTKERDQLVCVGKSWQYFSRPNLGERSVFSDGLGSFYEKSAEFIFGSKHDSGKVMGLAGFGGASSVSSRREFFEWMNWSDAFTGGSKLDWEASGRFSLYADLAATAQSHFEGYMLNLVTGLKRQFPNIDHLIITGGCALNCTTNWKLHQLGLFNEIYIPPFPGDESVGLGSAVAKILEIPGPSALNTLSHEKQKSFWGPEPTDDTSAKLEDIFSGFIIERPDSITDHCAKLLSQGKIIAWHQGRSETGPRALGHRSILADARIPDLKNILNAQIKFRESFRPYGCSVRHENAHKYFMVPMGFNNPFMSFAVPLKVFSRGQHHSLYH